MEELQVTSFLRDDHYLVKMYPLRDTGLIVKATHGSFWILQICLQVTYYGIKTFDWGFDDGLECHTIWTHRLFHSLWPLPIHQGYRSAWSTEELQAMKEAGKCLEYE